MSKTPKKFKDTKLGKGIYQLRDELKPMSWKQRIDHIWTYYKEYIFLFLILAIISVGFITSWFTGRKDSYVTGILVNLNVEQDGMNFLSRDYAQKLGLKDTDLVEIEYTYFENPLINLEDNNYYAAMIVENEVGAQMLDYMIVDHMAMEFFTTREVYMDLRKFFSEEELIALAMEDRLIYVQEASEESYWPAAVKITNTGFVEDYILNGGEAYFAVAGNTEKLEQVRGIWDYITYYKEKTVTGATVNVKTEEKGKDFLSKDYAKHLGLTNPSDVALKNIRFEDPEETLDSENAVVAATMEKWVAEKKLDYGILNKISTTFYSKYKVFQDLRQFFTEEELKTLAAEDRLIYSDAEKTVPVAIKMTDTAFAKSCVTEEGDIFFAVTAAAEKKDQIRKLWAYINSYKAN